MRPILFLMLAAGGLHAETYFVTVQGEDAPARTGTAVESWKTLAYACERVPAGKHIIQLEAGTFTAVKAAKPKSGVTVAGRGRTTRIVAAADWKLGDVTAIPKPADEFLIVLEKPKEVTIQDLAMESDPQHRISGAVRCAGGNGVVLRNLELREFRWAALYVEHSSQIEIDRCDIENGSTDKDKFHSGAIRTKWFKNSTIHHCRIINTVGSEYGYKAGGHERVRIHHNYFELRGEFALESAHENEYGLEIDHNSINRCISVPKSNQGDDPNKRKFEYSVRIHHNLLTDSYTVEGPRNHLQFDHNYIRIEKTGGRCYSHHGGINQGPITIHHNIVENVDRAFVWKNNGTSDNVHVWNNTVYAADAEKRAGAFIDVAKPDLTKGWSVKNNVFVAPASQPRKLCTGLSLGATHNLGVGLSSMPEGNLTGEPGFHLMGDKPQPFFMPAGQKSFVIGRGVDVGLPFMGAAPTLGAFELDTKQLLTEIPSAPAKTSQK